MKVTSVSICLTKAARLCLKTAMTSELFAATGASYSRSNEALDTILSKIDPKNLDNSVDRHLSID